MRIFFIARGLTAADCSGLVHGRSRDELPLLPDDEKECELLARWVFEETEKCSFIHAVVVGNTHAHAQSVRGISTGQYTWHSAFREIYPGELEDDVLLRVRCGLADVMGPQQSACCVIATSAHVVSSILRDILKKECHIDPCSLTVANSVGRGRFEVEERQINMRLVFVPTH